MADEASAGETKNSANNEDKRDNETDEDKLNKSSQHGGSEYHQLVATLERKSDQDRELLASLLYFQQKERRTRRRWSVFFKLFYLAVTALIVFVIFFSSGSGVSTTIHGKAGYSAMIDIKGPIAQDEMASADRVNSALRAAFNDVKVKGVVLRINSPGGSPVQAGYIFDEVMRLKKANPQISVYAVITDIGASAAYFIAASADEIYADSSSLVGSIGAYMASFGFDKAMNKLGVTRRFYKSGEYKGFSDPFQPENSKAADHITQSVRVIHKYFIARVKEGRGNRLKNDSTIFSGLIWSGKEALSLGLVDGLSNVRNVVKNKMNLEDIVDFTVPLKPWERFARDVGVGAASVFTSMFGASVH